MKIRVIPEGDFFYGQAIKLAEMLIAWEFEFKYSYQNRECIFEILGGPNDFLSLHNQEFRDIAFVVL